MYKIPESVLVVIYTPDLDVLLLRRAHMDFECWQSVTGSRKAADAALWHTAQREVGEETGLDVTADGCLLTDWHQQHRFEIDPAWGGNFAPGVTHNVEHVFGLQVPHDAVVRLNPREHQAFDWWPWRDAAARCASWTNRDACLALPEMTNGAPDVR